MAELFFAAASALAEKGAADFRRWLETEGVANIENVNNALKAATPWFSIYGVEEPVLAK